VTVVERLLVERVIYTEHSLHGSDNIRALYFVLPEAGHRGCYRTRINYHMIRWLFNEATTRYRFPYRQNRDMIHSFQYDV
jgi:hypothetical protein